MWKHLALLTLIGFGLFIGKANIVAAEQMFKDIGETHRAQQEIYYLSDGEIVQGYKGYYNPNRYVTRAEAATMIGRALELDGKKRESTFKDVSATLFASGYIQSAVEQGIITGYGDNTFRPNGYVTRGEMALLISRAFQYVDTRKASEAVAALKEQGIIKGYADGSYGEKDSIIRADFALLLARTINPDFRTDPPPPEEKLDALVTATILNVRKGPLSAFSVAGTVYNGTKLVITNTIGNWAVVQVGKTKGYVHKDYLFVPKDKETLLQDFLATQTIVIDAGHGGKDGGTSSTSTYEKDLVLDMVLKVQSLFSKTPFKVVLTRDSDVFLSLPERVEVAKQNKGKVFLSIHANAFNGQTSGTETYYYAKNVYANDNKLLASFTQKRIVEALGLVDRGIKRGDYHVIRENNKMPAILAEIGFVDHPTDREKLKSEEWRQKAAEAIYFSILDYYQSRIIDVSPLYDLNALPLVKKKSSEEEAANKTTEQADTSISTSEEATSDSRQVDSSSQQGNTSTTQNNTTEQGGETSDQAQPSGQNTNENSSN